MSTPAERSQEVLDSIWMNPEGISQYPVQYQETETMNKISFDGRNFMEYPPAGWTKIYPVAPTELPMTD